MSIQSKKLSFSALVDWPGELDAETKESEGTLLCLKALKKLRKNCQSETGNSA